MSIFNDYISAGKTGRHETFAPRYGWIKKGFEKAKADPRVFNAANDIEQLGVGKNMVRSIKYWCTAFGVLEPSDNAKNGRKGEMVATEFGRFILDNETGADPFMEDDATLWPFHWMLFRPPYLAVTWPLAFSFVNLSVFDGKKLATAVQQAVGGFDGLKKISPNSFAKDTSCITRMYRADRENETEIRCPFEQLDLIVSAGSKREFTFNLLDKRSLPPLVFLACCLDYAGFAQPETVRNISLSNLSCGIGSPGTAFKLSETACGEKIVKALSNFDGAEFVETNGIRQLHYREAPSMLFRQCLEAYYKRRDK